MKLRIVYFAAARELAESSAEQLELSSAAHDISALRALLSHTKPRLAPYLARMRFAVNGDIASDSHVLADGDEVTVLPPVAGGSAGGSVLAEVRTQPLSVDEVLASVRSTAAGASVVFLGMVRDHADGKPVARLDYEAYVQLANREMQRILLALMAEYPGTLLAATHRVGELAVGDIAVVVAASAPHRGDAFATCRLAIDRIKESVPIWKKEWSPDGSALWINLESDQRK